MGAVIGTYANTDHVQELQRGTSGAIHIRGLAELSYTIIVGEKQDQLASPAINRTTVIPGGNGASFLVLEYMDIAAVEPVGKRLFVVFNAQSSADANAKLGTPGQRYVVPIGGWREWAFEPNQMLLRLDFCSDAASESNGSLVTWEYGLLFA